MGGGEGFTTDVAGLVFESAVSSTSAIVSSTAAGVGLVDALTAASTEVEVDAAKGAGVRLEGGVGADSPATGAVELLPHAAVNTNTAAINEIATSARVSRSRSVLTNSIRLKTNYQLFEKYLERRSQFDCAISGQQDQMRSFNERSQSNLRSHALQGFFGCLQGFVDVFLFDPAHVTQSKDFANQRFLSTTKNDVVVLVYEAQKRLAV